MGLLMDELKAALRIVLANKFLMYFKAQSYHWNVEGMFFSQYHDFFGKIYEEVYGSIDATAEELRALDAYAPISINEMYSYATIDEDAMKPSNITDMVQNLFIDNAKVIESLNSLFEIADKQNEQGLADFAAGRLDAHKKHAWMLSSTLKKTGN
jgi:starvation-inducible DNA-binding protein